MGRKDHWKSKFQHLSKAELEDKLCERLNPRVSLIHKILETGVWSGAFGAATHITDREKESQRRALKKSF